MGLRASESTGPGNSMDSETPTVTKKLIATVILPSREKMRMPATREGIN